MRQTRNSRIPVPAVLGVCVCTVAGGCTSPPQPTLRVVTLNIAHGRGLALSVTAVPRPMIQANLDVALQEADVASAPSGGFDHVAHLATAAHYPHRFAGRHVRLGTLGHRAEYGTALLSQLPLLSPVSVPFRAWPLDTKGFVTAEIEFAGRRLLVGSAHLDAFSTEVRLKQATCLVEYLETTDLPIVLMGDFNCEWGQSKAVQRIADGLNLHAYRLEAGDLMTFPTHNPMRRLDWILVSEDQEFVDYQTCPDQLSDHLAVTAQLRWRE